MRALFKKVTFGRALRAVFTVLFSAYVASALGFLGLSFPNRQVEELEKKVTGMDCYEITEHSWDIQDFIIIDQDSISLKTKAGLARFKKPVTDIFALDFIFRPTASNLNTTIALKDEKNNEISLSIGAGNYKSFHWIYRKSGKIIEDEKRPLTAPIQQNSEVKLRLETVQKPTYLLASGYFLYTPADKKAQVPVYLKDIPLERFYNEEVFLHLGIENNNQDQVDGVVLKIIQCKIIPKQESEIANSWD